MQSAQIVLTREHQGVPWGFRLKGGAEYNVPLSILKVNPSSPAYTKLECTDVIQSIGNYSAVYLKHEEALNIIRLFEYHLPLVIKRESSANEINPNASLFWSPSQAPGGPGEAFHHPPQNGQPQQKPTSNFNSSFQHNLSAGPAWPQPHNNVVAHNFGVENGSHDPYSLQNRPEEERSDYKSQYQYQPIYQQSFPVGLQQDGAAPLVVPPALIRAMTGSALGKKPFTYTPGGLDLSHIRQSARVKRYDQQNKNFEIRPQEQQQQRAFTPSFIDEHGDYQTYISDSSYMKNKLKIVNGNEPQFGGVSAEHLVRPNKHKDLVNQSTSFRMLNRWIQESEQHPKQVEPEQRRHTEKLLESSQVVPAGMRYQERDIAKFQGESIPSKTFKYLQYLTQEELELEAQEKKKRREYEQAHPQTQEPQQQTQVSVQSVARPRSVSSLSLNIENSPSTTFTPRMNQPKPVMSQPISFQSSPLNRDRQKVNFSSNSTSYNMPVSNDSNNVNNFQAPANYSIIKNPTYGSAPPPVRKEPTSYPFAQTLNYEPPKNLPVFDNNPPVSSSVSVNTESSASVFKEEPNETVECSFLPSESSCNETSFKFNNIFENNSTEQTVEVDVQQTEVEVAAEPAIEEVTESVQESELAVEAVPEPETVVEASPEAESAVEASPEAEPVLESEPAVEVVEESKNEVPVEIEAAPESEPAVENVPELAVEAAPEAETVVEVVPEVVPEVEPVVESVPEVSEQVAESTNETPVEETHVTETPETDNTAETSEF